MITDKILKNALIIDVRESFEFISKHIKGALNLPLSSIPFKVEELKTQKRPLVLYCKSGNRSGQGVKFLKSNGLDDVYNGGSLADMVRRMDTLASYSM